MTKTLPPIFVAVAWPYVNGDMHIGHYAGCLLPADISARYFRTLGHEVLMVSGSDCHGTPITIEADKRGVTPSTLVEEYHLRWEKALSSLGSTYDLYTTTTTPIHKKLTQDFFVVLAEKGLIIKDSSEQYFSSAENKFLPDRYVEGTCPKCGAQGARSDQCDHCGSVLSDGELVNPVSKNSGAPVTLKRTEHYFVDWPKLQPFLEKYFDEKKSTWREWIAAETKKWLKEGLRPRAITRDLDWGIEIPTDRLPKNLQIEGAGTKRIYVWFDAVIGYLSASMEWATLGAGRDWKKFWHTSNAHHLYFMGKDNLVFHTLFWPGQLFGFDASLHLPDAEAVCQFLTLEGKKLSKSRGVHLDPLELVNNYGLDAVRFYFGLISPETSDSDFTLADFAVKNNSILVANIGNFVNRTLKLAEGISLEGGTILPETLAIMHEAFSKAHEKMWLGSIRGYIDEIVTLGMNANKQITVIAPWKHKDRTSKEFKDAISNCVALVCALGALLQAVTPVAAQKLQGILGISGTLPFDAYEIQKIINVIRVQKVDVLYARIEIAPAI